MKRYRQLKCKFILDIAYTLGAVVVICITAGYLYAKLDNASAKKTVPDCGSCKLYKGTMK